MPPLSDRLRAVAPDPAADATLLARYAADRDEYAAAELVRRHGGLVYGVCRRILADPHDTDDAFQAVWLVFARRAGSVRADTLAGWLYGVAVRTATKAKAMAAKRRARVQTSDRCEPADPSLPPAPEQSELLAALDAELARLPAELRTAVFACDLGDQPRKQAAAALGWPEGTLAGRLRQARARLAVGLRRRGFALPATVALVLPVPPAASAAAVGLLRGSVVPPGVHALAEAVMRTWKPKLLVLGFALTLLTAGGVLLAGNQPPAKPRPPAGPRWSELPPIDTPGWLPGSVAFAPDGRTLFVGGAGGSAAAFETTGRNKLWEYKANSTKFAAVAVHPDGKTLAMTVKDGLLFLDPATGKLTDKLEDADSKPSVVAFFADQPVGADGVPPQKKVIYGSDRRYAVQSWLKWPMIGTIELQVREDRAQPQAIPLAVGPLRANGSRAVTIGPMDGSTGKNVLWAWAAGSGAGNQRLDGHFAPVTAAAWAADGNVLLTGDADGEVIAWHGDELRPRNRVKLGGQVTALAVTADGTRAAAGVVRADEPQVRLDKQRTYQEQVFVWNPVAPPANPTPLAGRSVEGQPDVRAGLAFAPDGKTLAAAFADYGHLTKGTVAGRVRVWRRAE